MGVPKFFRWLSERYPKINQRHGSLPNPETCERYFGKPPPPPSEMPDPLSQCGLPPEIDRLYLDMNGIIHGCSHNNNVEDDETGSSSSLGPPKPVTRKEIFRNVCYYLDRIIGDIVQPNELVYMAIDGVAPRAKLNQQRARRYRSGLEGQIETTIYEAHAQKLAKEETERLAEERNLLMGGRSEIVEATPFSMDDGYSFTFNAEPVSGEATHPNVRTNSRDPVEEVSPGRFKGKFEATTTPTTEKPTASSQTASNIGDDDEIFHSNVITPGTPFFQEFTSHVEQFVKYKISTDPKWQKLTIIFSGPNVSGEGEHKIMDFIRTEKRRPDYNPNMRHCIMGQDGDLIMLGLATHEPNLVLLRERVVFNMAKRRVATAQSESGLDAYLHNGHFEFLHMGVLRDYLAYEFETSNVMTTSPFDLEHTIDDFVFMTFFVGNDFLPHMPALDIADHAFDLLFLTYKKCRRKWAEEDPDMPYLTHAGNIISGRRLEDFLAVVGGHEGAYYDKKKNAAPTEEKRIKRVYKRYGMNNALPDASLVASKEESDRAAYREMLMQEHLQFMEDEADLDEEPGAFSPVMSGGFQPLEDERDIDDGLISRLGSLLHNSLNQENAAGISQSSGIDDTDLKGRYYYDKFQFTPFDEEKHLALRKAYIEGLVWNLKYYYEGCPSWEWFFPYHYGPMLSDLLNLDDILNEITFKGREGTPLKPFEQLLGCMPPSQSHHLPQPYRKLMTDPDSPIIDFYPESFTVDMNGKRWPWEAVTLLPFIDSTRLIEAASKIDDTGLSDEERSRNSFGDAVVFSHDPNFSAFLEGIGESEGFQALDQCTARGTPFSESPLYYYPEQQPPVLEPKLATGVVVPLSGFGTLEAASVQSLWRRNLGVDVFSSRSRYRTACLEMSNIFSTQDLPPIELLAAKYIGGIVYVNYPYFLQGYVTAISNEVATIRGEREPRPWKDDEANAWKNKRDGLIRQFVYGEGMTGTGGIRLPDESSITLSVRPFEKIVSTKDGTDVKSFAKFEVEVPLMAIAWSPKHVDHRLENLPSKLEKNRFELGLLEANRLQQKETVKSPKAKGRKRLFPPRKKSVVGQSASFSTFSRYQAPSRSLSTDASLACAAPTNLGVFSGNYRIKDSVSNAHRTLPSNARTYSNVSRPTLMRHSTGKSPKGRVIMAGVLAITAFFGAAHASVNVPSNSCIRRNFAWPKNRQRSKLFVPSYLLKLRGGDIEETIQVSPEVPPLEFFHGTTTLSFVFDGGIIAAVDSRASLGSFVGSKTTQKVLPVSSHILGTMAGGAADCMHWIRNLKSKALLHELTEGGKRMSVARASRLLSNALYESRGQDLSIGTMIMGYDDVAVNGKEDALSLPRIFYVDNIGKRIEGKMFAVGSGSTFALGILDTELKPDLSVDDAIGLGIKAIRHATFRDAYSGGTINVYHITKEGWRKVYTEDISRG